MNTTETRQELVDYLRRVRAALADLPADELAEVMEDVEPHLAEVLDETGDLTGRLGTPEDYAAELRAAGGYPPPASADSARGKSRLAARYFVWSTALLTFTCLVVGGMLAQPRHQEKYLWLFFTLLAAAPGLVWVFSGYLRRADVESLPEYRFARARGVAAAGLPSPRVVEFIRSLRPGWWVARVVLVLALMLVGATEGVVVAVVVVAFLTWAGPRSSTDRRLLPLVVAGNALLATATLTVVLYASDRSSQRPYEYVSPGLNYQGKYLDNVYAVDADGKPIPEFYLYDHEGMPLNVVRNSCESSSRAFDNRFPQPQVEYRGGQCVELSGLPFVPLPPNATLRPSTTSVIPSTSATTTPVSPSPSVSLSPSVTTTPVSSAPATTTTG
ncbi:hypothetical protein V5P93_001764 [Actinokineospora auranticolor]|uniref:Proline-rich protein n=1 Tax=Actinokineospora auranticolor TaxID=155976 RepID=A0A2S6GGK4_9PSEU|nr:hypothetical protein [Actinokineospora auranticolor]PPK64368.1 hypothetical protein CLV40_12091 [Actinokineospora auranticolor]